MSATQRDRPILDSALDGDQKQTETLLMDIGMDIACAWHMGGLGSGCKVVAWPAAGLRDSTDVRRGAHSVVYMYHTLVIGRWPLLLQCLQSRHIGGGPLHRDCRL